MKKLRKRYRETPEQHHRGGRHLRAIVAIVVVLAGISLFRSSERVIDALERGGYTTGYDNIVYSSGFAVVGTQRENNNGYYDDDSASWKPPRIVILAGPHKTASSSLQKFFSEFAGSSVLIDHRGLLEEAEDFRHKELRRPHPSNDVWVVPVLPRKAGGVIKSHHALAQFVAMKPSAEFPKKQQQQQQHHDEADDVRADPIRRAAIAGWFRRHLAARWNDGKKLILAAEAFDYVVVGLRDHLCGGDENDSSSGHHRHLGEMTHVAPGSDERIDNLLDLLPFDDDDSHDDYDERKRQQPPLKMNDIEIQINYRTPRFDHLVSLWHQMGKTQTLRDWLVKPETMSTLLLYENLTTINSLGEALQYVRRGLRVTLVDMAGVAALDDDDEDDDEAGEAAAVSASSASASGRTVTTVIGGLQGVVACEILRMDRQGLCDDRHRLRIPNFPVDAAELRVNVQADRSEQALTEPQIEEMRGILDGYDCGIRKHLRKYERRGLLRILHPSEDLFSTCVNDDPDLSFCEMVGKLVAVASRDNGIPRGGGGGRRRQQQPPPPAKNSKKKEKKDQPPQPPPPKP